MPTPLNPFTWPPLAPTTTTPDLIAALNTRLRRLTALSAVLQPLTVQPPPVVASANLPAQAWNVEWNTPTAQSALQLNLTDTSSPATSLLVDLKVNGVTLFSVRKDGLITGGGFALTPPAVLGTDPDPLSTALLRVAGPNSALFGGYTLQAGATGGGTVPSGDFRFLSADVKGGEWRWNSHGYNAGGGGSSVGWQFAYTEDTTSTTAHLYGVAVGTKFTGSGTYHEMNGADIAAISSGAGHVDEAWGARFTAGMTAGAGEGTMDYAIAASVGITHVAGGAQAHLTNAIGLGVFWDPATPGLASKATNQYGVLVGDITGGTLNYAWYSGLGRMRLGDLLSIVAAPAANNQLSLSRDGAAANTWNWAAYSDASLYMSRGDHSNLFTFSWDGTGGVFTASHAVSATVLTGTLSTAAQANVTSLGTLTGLTIGGNLTFSGASRKIIAGTTDWALRNNADNATNIGVTDAGAITFRNTITVTASGIDVTGTTVLRSSPLDFTAGAGFVLGTTDNNTLTVKTNALNRWQYDTSGNLIADTTNGGYLAFRPGTAAVTAKATGVLFQTADASTTSTSEASIASYTLKGHTLDANGQMLTIVLIGSCDTQNGTLIIKLGASNVMSQAITANHTYTAVCHIWRLTGATAWRGEFIFYDTTVGTTTVTRNDTATKTDDLSTDLTLDFRGLVTSGGTLRIREGSVRYEAA